MKTNKQLIIARHGKSSWDYEGIADIDRPLNLRGIKNAHEMARRFLTRKIQPEWILTSPANRALHTATIFARILNIPFQNFFIEERIYTADAPGIVEMISGLEDHIPSVMIFGHNPTFTSLANHFLEESIDNIPTAGMVRLEFAVDQWKEIDINTVSKSFFDYPKKINA